MENQDMKGFILAILVIGLTLVFGIYLADTMHTNFLATGTTGSVTNETLTAVNETGVTLNASLLSDGSCSAITECINNSAGSYATIPAANYTLTGCSIAYSGIEDTFGFNDTSWICSYTYTYTAETDSSTASGSLVTSLSGGSSWITILIVVGFAVIVLGMLSEGLGNAARGVGGMAPQYTY